MRALDSVVLLRCAGAKAIMNCMFTGGDVGHTLRLTLQQLASTQLILINCESSMHTRVVSKKINTPCIKYENKLWCQPVWRRSISSVPQNLGSRILLSNRSCSYTLDAGSEGVVYSTLILTSACSREHACEVIVYDSEDWLCR